jgi:tetratricopeptide (TPR) repeat protein
LRDNFPANIKRILGGRAGFKCSNPKCSSPTIGPKLDPEEVLLVGEAAHITAASPGGPRYEPTLTPDERKGIANAIWLCEKCAKLVDSDPAQFTVEILRLWKAQCERNAAEDLQNPVRHREACVPGQPHIKPEDSIDRGRAWDLYLERKFDEAAVELRKWTKLHPEDRMAWDALAWCHYVEHHYKDALVAVSKALQIKGDSTGTLAIKACILAEEGIVTCSRASLLQAKEIFTSLVAKGSGWTSHYNLGNTLSALGEHEAAIEEYRKATALDPLQPCAWKNFANAYFHLGRHKEEFECYDRALALDPTHEEALISKGITLLSSLGKPAEGIVLLESALRTHPEAGNRWPHLWYWLGFGYQQVKDLRTAFAKVGVGLELAPNHSGLLNLKAQILADLWKQDNSYIPHAIEYFSFVLGLSPTSRKAFAELGGLYLAKGDEASAWALIDRRATTIGGSPSTVFKAHGVRVQDALVAWKYLADYESYRKQYPTGDYKELLGEAVTSVKEEWLQEVSTLASLSFGAACEILSSAQGEVVSDALLARVQKSIHEWTIRTIPFLASPLAEELKGYKSSPEHAEKIAGVLTPILVGLVNIGLLEASGQMGFISPIFAIDPEVLMTFVKKDESGNQLGAEISKEIVTAINHELKIFPE